MKLLSLHVERVLFLSPHDDDALIGCGGLISQLAEQGTDVSVVVLTDGGLGYSSVEDKLDIAERRKQEALEAYTTLGASVQFLGYPDMDLRNYQNWTAIDGSPGGYQQILKLVREFRPDMALLPNLNDRHPDHQAAYEIGRTAVWQAGETIAVDFGTPHRVDQVLMYQVWDDLEGQSHVFSLDESLQKLKKEALSSFISQQHILETIETNAEHEYFEKLQF
ncbi:MAG: PIG-L deacetylase family protein [Candidatus Kariarchaeaceae archaeon]